MAADHFGSLIRFALLPVFPCENIDLITEPLLPATGIAGIVPAIKEGWKKTEGLCSFPPRTRASGMMAIEIFASSFASSRAVAADKPTRLNALSLSLSASIELQCFAPVLKKEITHLYSQ